MKALNLDTNEICRLYRDEKLSRPEIAERFHCSSPTILLHLKKGNCQTRSLKEAINLKFDGGKKHPNYKDGRISSGRGYIYITDKTHPRAQKSGYIFEHIVIWERTHNRILPKGWVIHHLNGIKDDNRPSNLKAMKRGEHNNLGEPYKKRIRELEAEVMLLKSALERQQLIFTPNEN